MRRDRLLAVLLLTLGVGTAAVALLGPAGVGVLTYRTSPTTLAQLVGADVAGLVVVAPVCLVVAVLAWRGHRAAPLLAMAPALYAVYTFTQYVLGQEYLRVPGNVERFFPLLLALVVLGGVVAVLAWRRVQADPPPLPGRRLERVAGAALVLLALFLVVGLHLPGLVDAMSADPQRVEYVSSPAAFWVVKLMDLGVLVPVSLATGVGLLRGRRWAVSVACAVLGGYALVGTSVVTMAVVMLLRSDPDASGGLAAGLGAFAAVFWVLAVAMYRPLFRVADTGDEPAPQAAGQGDRPRRLERLRP